MKLFPKPAHYPRKQLTAILRDKHLKSLTRCLHLNLLPTQLRLHLQHQQVMVAQQLRFTRQHLRPAVLQARCHKLVLGLLLFQACRLLQATHLLLKQPTLRVKVQQVLQVIASQQPLLLAHSPLRLREHTHLLRQQELLQCL